MSILDLEDLTTQREAGAPPIGHIRGKSRVYAIAFDMDIDSLRKEYGDPYNNAYLEIRRVLQRHGFTWQQGSVYFGDERINAQRDEDSAALRITGAAASAAVGVGAAARAAVAAGHFIVIDR